MRKILGFFRLKTACLVLAALGVVSMASPAQAGPDFRMRIDDGVTTGVVVTDDGGGDANAGSGIMNVTTSFGNFVVTVAIGMSKPLIPTGPGLIAEMDLVGVTVSASGGGTIRMLLEDKSFPGLGLLAFNSSIGGTSTGAPTITAQTWVDTTNAVPAYGASVFPAGALAALGAVPGTAIQGLNITSSSSPFAGANSVTFISVGPYSMFFEVDLQFGAAGGTASFDLNANVTPEPTSLVLALAGLPVLGLRFWRRRQLAA